MGFTTALLAGSFALGAGATLLSASQQSNGLQSQADYQDRLFKINSRIADIQAEQTLSDGREAVTKHQTATRQLIGAQRASLAAQGIDVESGSALDIQADTRYLSKLDTITMENNAFRTAWGYKMDAISSSFKGEFARLSGQNAAKNTLITGGLTAASQGLRAGSYFRGGGGLNPPTYFDQMP